MKRLTAVLAMLCVASLAHAQSRLATTTPSWGTYTPQGFVPATAYPNDTTFINGATAQVDTTGPVSTADWDWTPYDNTTANITAPLAAFKLFVAGSLVSYDTAFVFIEASMDGGTSWAATATSAYALTQIGAGGGTQQLLGSPVNLSAPTRGPLGLTSATATTGIHPLPLLRFIVRGDGNTAARGSGLRLSIAHHRTDGRDGHAPRMVWERIPFATYENDGFNGLRLTSYKDTSTVRFSAPDTTAWFDLAKALVGPAQRGAAVDTTQLGAYLFLQQTSDPTGNDSFYVCVDGAAIPGYKWNTTPLQGNAGGFLAGAMATTGPAGEPGALFGLPAHAVTALSAGPGALASTPFVRFRIFGGNGGEAAGGLKVWLGYWKNPYED